MSANLPAGADPDPIVSIDTIVSNAINVAIDTSRTSGVGPLAVFFDATATSGLLNDDYVGAYFEWNFDSTNIDPAREHHNTGFLAAHVFDAPGTYLVTLTVRDDSGATGIGQTNITVDATATAGWTTYCVSNAGTTCPVGGTPLSTFAQAKSVLAPNTRVLFKRGDSWNNVQWGFTGLDGPAVIGAYTDPNDPSAEAPIFRSSINSTSGIINPRDVHDLRISDIHIIGSDLNNGIVVGANSTNVLIQRVEIEHINGIAFSPGNAPFHTDGFFVFDSFAHDFTNYGLFANANRLAFVGNTITGLNAPTNGHGVRIAGGSKSIIQGNTITGNDTFTAITIRGRGPGSVNVDTIVSDNVVDDVITFQPQNFNYEEYVSHVLVERNVVRPPTGVPAIQDGININAQQVTVRNNVFYNVRRAVNPFTHPLSGAPVDLLVEGNTQYIDQETAWGQYFMGGYAQNATIRNNLMQSATTAKWSRFISSSYTQTSNNLAFYPFVAGACVGIDGTEGAAACADPRFLSTNPTNPNFLRLHAASPARDAGAWTAAYVDHAMVPRPHGGLMDVGAFEFAPSPQNRAPIITPVTHNALDRDPDKPGIQVYEGTPIDMSVAIAADPDGDTLTWEWLSRENGGTTTSISSGTMSASGIDDATFLYPVGSVSDYELILRVSDGTNTTTSSFDVQGERHIVSHANFENGLPLNSSTEGDVQIVDDGSGNNVAMLREGSDAAFSQTITLPDDVYELIFDYRFTNGGDGDMLRVSLDGITVFEQRGSEFAGVDFVTVAPIDVVAFAGQTAQLEFRLSSAGSDNAEIQVDDVTIVNGDYVAILFQEGSTATYTDADGDRVMVALSGPGTGQVMLTGQGPNDAFHLVLKGTNALSSVTITTAAGTITTIDKITVNNGSLNKFRAPTTNLASGFMATGSVAHLQLRDVLAGATTIDIGGTDAGLFSKLIFKRIKDLDLRIGSVVRAFAATDWQDTDGGGDRFEAPAVKSLLVKGDLANRSVNGQFDADLALSGSGTVLTALANAKIGGPVNNAVWDLNGSAGKIDIRGTLNGWTANVGGSLAMLKMTNAASADVSAAANVGKIKARQWLAGSLSAQAAGKLVISGDPIAQTVGDFGADVTLGSGDAVEQVLRRAKITGRITGGTWRMSGAAGAVVAGATASSWSANVLGKLNLLRTTSGDLSGTVSAGAFSRVKVQANLNSAMLLAGTNMGQDGRRGGVGASADTVTDGSIGSLVVRGAVLASVVGAGFDSVDGTFRDGNDRIAGTGASSIRTISIGGAAAASAYFGAGQYKSVRINGRLVDTMTSNNFFAT